MKTINLTNVDVASLKSLFTRSLTVDDTLYFEFEKDKISSFVMNEQNSFCKEWTTDSKGIFTADEDFDKLKFFILRGALFNNKILGILNKANWNVSVDEKGFVKQIHMIEGGLQFFVATNNMHFTGLEISPEKKALRFDLKDEVASFDLEPALIKELISISDIAEFSEETTDYLNFEGVSGVLTVSNNMFKKDIGAFTGADFSNKLSKSFLGLLDKEEVTAHVCVPASEDEAPKMVFVNKHAEIKSHSSAVLMTDVSSDDYDLDMDEDEGW